MKFLDTNLYVLLTLFICSMRNANASSESSEDESTINEWKKKDQKHKQHGLHNWWDTKISAISSEVDVLDKASKTLKTVPNDQNTKNVNSIASFGTSTSVGNSSIADAKHSMDGESSTAMKKHEQQKDIGSSADSSQEDFSIAASPPSNVIGNNATTNIVPNTISNELNTTSVESIDQHEISIAVTVTSESSREKKDEISFIEANTSTVATNTVATNTVAANTEATDTVAANTVTTNTVTANTVEANTVPMNTVAANTVATDTVTPNAIATNNVSPRVNGEDHSSSDIIQTSGQQTFTTVIFPGIKSDEAVNITSPLKVFDDKEEPMSSSHSTNVKERIEILLGELKKLNEKLFNQMSSIDKASDDQQESANSINNEIGRDKKDEHSLNIPATGNTFDNSTSSSIGGNLSILSSQSSNTSENSTPVMSLSTHAEGVTSSTTQASKFSTTSAPTTDLSGINASALAQQLINADVNSTIVSIQPSITEMAPQDNQAVRTSFEVMTPNVPEPEHKKMEGLLHVFKNRIENLFQEMSDKGVNELTQEGGEGSFRAAVRRRVVKSVPTTASNITNDAMPSSNGDEVEEQKVKQRVEKALPEATQEKPAAEDPCKDAPTLAIRKSCEQLLRLGTTAKAAMETSTTAIFPAAPEDPCKDAPTTALRIQCEQLHGWNAAANVPLKTGTPALQAPPIVSSSAEAPPIVQGTQTQPEDPCKDAPTKALRMYCEQIHGWNVAANVALKTSTTLPPSAVKGMEGRPGIPLKGLLGGRARIAGGAKSTPSVTTVSSTTPSIATVTSKTPSVTTVTAASAFVATVPPYAPAAVPSATIARGY